MYLNYFITHQWFGVFYHSISDQLMKFLKLSAFHETVDEHLVDEWLNGYAAVVQ